MQSCPHITRRDGVWYWWCKGPSSIHNDMRQRASLRTTDRVRATMLGYAFNAADQDHTDR